MKMTKIISTILAAAIGIAASIATTVSAAVSIPNVKMYATGDVNKDGRVDIMDASTLSTAFANGRAIDTTVGDIDSNGVINMCDVVSLNRIIAKIDIKFSVGKTTSASLAPASATDTNVLLQGLDRNGKFNCGIFTSGGSAFTTYTSSSRSGDALFIGGARTNQVMGMSDKYGYIEDTMYYTSVSIPRIARTQKSIYNGTFDNAAVYLQVIDNQSSDYSFTERTVNVYDASRKWVCSYTAIKQSGTWSYMCGMSAMSSSLNSRPLDSRAIFAGFNGIIKEATTVNN